MIEPVSPWLSSYSLLLPVFLSWQTALYAMSCRWLTNLDISNLLGRLPPRVDYAVRSPSQM